MEQQDHIGWVEGGVTVVEQKETVLAPELDIEALRECQEFPWRVVPGGSMNGGVGRSTLREHQVPRVWLFWKH